VSIDDLMQHTQQPALFLLGKKPLSITTEGLFKVENMKPQFSWWAMRDSNPRPLVPEKN
jgi:hypothetical protein